MSVIYLLNTHNLEINDELINSLDEKRKNKILKTSNIVKKQELIGAYLLLKESLLLDYKYELDNNDLIYNENGKPYLLNKDIYFSISHSNGIVICSLSKEEIGIDIEEIKDIDKKIINKVLNDEELNIYKRMDNKNQLTYFYEIWCSKEAYIKKHGLSLPITPKLINIEDNCVCKKIKIANMNLMISACGYEAFRIIERHIERKETE